MNININLAYKDLKPYHNIYCTKFFDRYACKRGMKFEDDPALEFVVYECTDGSEQYTKRGFVNTPSEPDKWPRCMEGIVYKV